MIRAGAVAAGHPLTAEAALEALDAGGSAADAALAATAAACVVEPVLASLGGGGFLLWDPAEGDATIYDFFVDTPRRPKPEQDLDFHAAVCDFGTATQTFHIGLGAVAVPGMVPGLVQIQRDLARLPMARLLQPAVRFAREGFLLSELQAYILRIVEPIQAHSPALDGLFRTEDGRRIDAGDRLRQTELADTLELLGREALRPFLEGEPAAALLTLMQDGGHLEADDLTSMRVLRRRPLLRRHAGAEIRTMPAPSSGGLLISFALDLAEFLEVQTFGSPDHLIGLARIMASTDQARRDSGLAVAAGEAEETAAAQRLGDPATLRRYVQAMAEAPQVARGTTHISVVDGEGNLASVSLSNGEGCGYLLPGTGIHLNNMLGEEDLNPHGFHLWPAGVRMGSMMAPTTAKLADGRRIALGSGGSNRLRGAILQVLLNLTDFRRPLSDAVAAPRLHVEKGIAHVEPGFEDAVLEALEREVGALQLWEAPNLYFGGVHAVAGSGIGQLEAVGDPRRGGVGRVAEQPTGGTGS
ncbi:gamma-glutamyltransferase [Algihabitans albus]|uniref:gamma-glutamyltransferase n=1 Tax=Algihabitans albus TaxID=2164067 RepID=UPI000E5C9C93|nr:gamma-glutamyltransferase [Algihabitans albus]